MKKNIILLILTFSFLSCNNSNKLYDTAQKESMDYNENHLGKQLMETHCYTCHNAATAHDHRLAPPMIAVKKHYMNHNTTKEEFIKDIQSWVENPNEADAKMYGAVKRFGVMPKANYKKEDIERIADYMYDHTIERPKWFQKYRNEQNRKQIRKGKSHKNT